MTIVLVKQNRDNNGEVPTSQLWHQTERTNSEISIVDFAHDCHALSLSREEWTVSVAPLSHFLAEVVVSEEDQEPGVED